ncbi:cadherin-related family member 4 isoform X11 [Vulpes lagopus]|uniref:cadherin-related family member 4 isoform X11 n=1 Tax=Vulpes lagopus TaxID=494514 RepID=UPI001BC9C65C|nr:cadherin-related family member 4 isoform X11 [Vulpes lagopus]
MMALLGPPVLLLALVASEVHCLPWFINISESQGPGTILKSFPFNCTLHMPILELIHVKPPTTFFNPPSLTRWHGIYMGMVTLSSSARLDALAVNHYELQLRFTCGNYVMEGLLFVDVQRDPGYSSCAGRFASPAGEIIQVRETVTPGTQLYTLLLPGVELQRAQISIISAQDPPYFPGPFSINGQGWLLAPSQGLKGQGQKVFQLQILVTFGQNRSCHGTLKVKVLPAPSSQISFLTEIRETTLVGTVLNTFTCTDPDSSGSTLDYKLRFYSPPGLASLCLRDRALEVNATLDCDAPGACFQHAASILVLNGDQPLTEVPVLVMVTPVNEFSPACVPHTFRIREDAGPYTLLGSVVGMDKDYPHNSVEYFISGGPSTFSVDRLSGEIHLLGSLDYELQKSYRLTVLVTDHSQDQDPTQRRSGSCTITIEVEDVNDHSPECQPPFQELTIYTPLGRSVEVTKVSCWVPQEPQRLTFSYSIVGGEGHGGHQAVGEGAGQGQQWFPSSATLFSGTSQSRFSLQGAILVYNDITLGPPWPEQPHSYELLICVADSGPSIPHLSTTATIIVHVVPWNASTAATRIHRVTVRGVPSMMTPLLVTDTEVFWQPEPWFVVVLTVTSALFLLALGWLFSRLFQGLAQMLQTPNKPAHELLLNSIQGTEESIEGFMEAPRMEMPQAPSSVMSLEHFDGRAQDPREPPSSQTTLHLGPLSLLSPSQYFLLHQAFTIYFFPEWGLFSPPFTFQLMFLKHL